MEKTSIAPGNSTATTPASLSAIVPGWVKKIKSTEVGTFALGLAAYNLLFTKSQHGQPVPHPIPDAGLSGEAALPNLPALETAVLENGKVATTVNDEMSFGDAFRASRTELGAGHFFRWRGRLFNNFTEEEWSNMTEAEQLAFVQQTGKFTTEDMTTEPEMQTSEPAVKPRDIAGEPDRGSQQEEAINQFSENHNQQKMEYIDIDNEQIDQAALINLDDDPEAEVIQFWANDGASYALVDTNNTGMLDTLVLIDENGNAYNPVPLEEEIPAPKLTREQHLDLIGHDGIIDSLARDTKGDARAEQVYTDMNKDGSYDVAYFDTTGDGKLDKMCKIVNGKLSSPVSLNEPFEAPIVNAIAGGTTPANGHGFSTPEGADILFAHDNDDIPGLDNDADIGDFH